RSPRRRAVGRLPHRGDAVVGERDEEVILVLPDLDAGDGPGRGEGVQLRGRVRGLGVLELEDAPGGGPDEDGRGAGRGVGGDADVRDARVEGLGENRRGGGGAHARHAGERGRVAVRVEDVLPVVVVGGVDEATRAGVVDEDGGEGPASVGARAVRVVDVGGDGDGGLRLVDEREAAVAAAHLVGLAGSRCAVSLGPVVLRAGQHHGGADLGCDGAGVELGHVVVVVPALERRDGSGPVGRVGHAAVVAEHDLVRGAVLEHDVVLVRVDLLEAEAAVQVGDLLPAAPTVGRLEDVDAPREHDVLVVGVDGDGEVVPGLPARVFVADAGVGIDGACQQGPVRTGVGASVESLDTAGGGRDGVYDLSVRGRRRDLDALDTGAREPVGPVVELRPATSVAG